MQGIEVKSNLIYYYGNHAGYVNNNKAVIDTIFKSDELIDWIAEKKDMEIEWRDGVFDSLSSGIMDIETGEADQFMNCRIWQLTPDADPLIKYIGYDELIRVQGCPPDPADYRVALCYRTDTDDLDEICNKYDENPNSDLVGGKVNLSDIIEIYGTEGSEFNYVDRKGFVEVEFEYRQEQIPVQPDTASQEMNIQQ